MQPQVSIVMPLRNEAQFIEQNLNQILAQDFPPERMEIIVADGMSDDGTREILQRFARENDRIHLIDNEELIVPTGLNAAIKMARGEIVIRIDGHCFVEKEFVSESVKALEAHPDAWATGGPIVHKARTATGRAVAEAMSHKIGIGNASHRFADFEGYGEGTAFPAVYSWVFDKIGYYDESLVRNQDDEFYFRLSKGGGRFWITPRIKYDYFVRETLRQLFRQFYQYSFWRIPVIKKHQQPTTMRQMVPSLFYITVLCLMIAGVWMRSPLVALGLPVVYACVLLAVGISKISSVGLNVAMRIPAAIAVMHAGYAVGMIRGAICHVLGIQAWELSNRKMVQLSR